MLFLQSQQSIRERSLDCSGILGVLILYARSSRLFGKEEEVVFNKLMNDCVFVRPIQKVDSWKNAYVPVGDIWIGIFVPEQCTDVYINEIKDTCLE
jgi:hypothetical protein